LIERMGAGAAPFGLLAPTLAPGSEANLVLVDPEAEWEAGADGWESRSHNSAFTGMRLRGRVLMTVAAGRVAYRQRSFAMAVAE
jgi:dihydroorotase